jgi:hypothetical protein
VSDSYIRGRLGIAAALAVAMSAPAVGGSVEVVERRDRDSPYPIGKISSGTGRSHWRGHAMAAKNAAAKAKRREKMRKKSRRQNRKGQPHAMHGRQHSRRARLRVLAQPAQAIRVSMVQSAAPVPLRSRRRRREDVRCANVRGSRVHARHRSAYLPDAFAGGRMSEKIACPNCGSDLKPRARSCPCGWAKPSTRSSKTISVGEDSAASPGDRDHFRCSWESNFVRCRYSASVSREQGPNARFLCFGHLQCWETGDGELGQRIVDESLDRIPDGGDYSAVGMLAAARKASVDAIRTAHDAQIRRTAQMMTEPRTGTHAHTVGALVRMEFGDDERRAERNAIRNEGPTE